MQHNSGPWWKFIIPRRITISPVRIYRWLNFYWRLKDEPVLEELLGKELIKPVDHGLYVKERLEDCVNEIIKSLKDERK